MKLTLLLLLIFLSHVVFAADDDDSDSSHQLVIIGVSGLTSRAFSPAYMPFSYGQASEKGVYATRMRSISTAYEMPAWISIFFGATPEEYGCESDYSCDIPSDAQDYRSVFDLLEYDYGYTVSLFSEHNVGPNPIYEALGRKRPVSQFSGGTTDMMLRGQDERHLPQTDHRVLFFHFSGAEHMGKSMGYDGEMYNAQIQCLDWQIQTLCDSLWEYEPERTTFVLVSEHGGSGYGHDSFDIHTIQVPFAMWGYGVAQRIDFDRRATTTPQIAPSILYALNLDIPDEWVHLPIHQPRDPFCTHSNIQRFWNSTYSGGVCPLQQSWSHEHTRLLNDYLLFFTILVYVCVGFVWAPFSRSAFVRP